MQTEFYKSLDRPIDIFGIKGKWLFLFLVGVGVVIIVGIVVGKIMSSGIGIATVFLGGGAVYLLCISLQSKVSYRQLTKYKASLKIYPYVKRRETICHILLPSKYSKHSWFSNNIKKQDK